MVITQPFKCCQIDFTPIPFFIASLSVEFRLNTKLVIVGMMLLSMKTSPLLLWHCILWQIANATEYTLKIGKAITRFWDVDLTQPPVSHQVTRSPWNCFGWPGLIVISTRKWSTDMVTGNSWPISQNRNPSRVRAMHACVVGGGYFWFRDWRKWCHPIWRTEPEVTTNHHASMKRNSGENETC